VPHTVDFEKKGPGTPACKAFQPGVPEGSLSHSFFQPWTNTIDDRSIYSDSSHKKKVALL
jgi:hypothetical protein